MSVRPRAPSPGRRRFLKQASCTGALGLLLPQFARGASAESGEEGGDAPPSRRVALLRTAADAGFANALQRRLRAMGQEPAAEIDLACCGATDIVALRAALAPLRGVMLVGLLPTPLAMLLELELHERGGSRWLHAVHVVGADGASRHQFESVRATAGIAARLAATLGPQSAPFSVNETTLGPAAPGEILSTVPVFATWDAALGDAYAWMAAGGWTPAPVIAGFDSETRVRRSPYTTSASFIAQI